MRVYQYVIKYAAYAPHLPTHTYPHTPPTHKQTHLMM